MKTCDITCASVFDAGFEAYGTVLAAETRLPDTKNSEMGFWNRLGVVDHSGVTSLSIVRTFGKNGLVERNLEQHAHSSETLIPTDDVILVVATSAASDPTSPDLSSVRAFRVERGCAVTLARGTWHHAPLTESEATDTFVLFEEQTPGRDCRIVDLPGQYGCEYRVVR